MGNSFRKMFDKLFGNKEMRVGPALRDRVLHLAATLAQKVPCLAASQLDLHQLAFTGGDARPGRSWQDHHPLQAPYRRDSQHRAHHRYFISVSL